MKIILTLTILILSGCTAGAPWNEWMFKGPPPGKEYHPTYVEGWVDGCETGASATSNQFYKFHHKFTQDPYKAQDKVYYKGWRDALDYCSNKILQYDQRIFL